MKERRHYKRFNAQLETNYTKAEGLVTISSLSRSDDISAGGLRATFSRIIKTGDSILIQLKLHSNKRLVILAKVVWSKPMNGNGKNLCGLNFSWVSPKSLLEECIAAEAI